MCVGMHVMYECMCLCLSVSVDVGSHFNQPCGGYQAKWRSSALQAVEWCNPSTSCYV